MFHSPNWVAPLLHPIFSQKVHPFFHWIVEPNLCSRMFQLISPSNLSTKLIIQFFSKMVNLIVSYSFWTKLLRPIGHFICQPNNANHFPTQFSQIFSPTPFAQFSHPNHQHNFSRQFSKKLSYQNLPHKNLPNKFSNYILHLSPTHKSCHTICQPTLPTLLPV